MNTYRYFLIYGRDKHILYGECIEWRCGEFDSKKLKDVTISLNKKYKARFITSDTRIDVVNANGVDISFPDEIFFNYDEKYDDFITQRSDEVIFSPLIDRCCDITSFVGKEITGVEFIPWVEEHENLLAEIKNRFDLDLLRRPELINTYTFYTPVRLIANCRFTDKPERGDNRLPTKIKVKFHDEFEEYQDANYLVRGYCKDMEPESHEGLISEVDVEIDFSESPEQLEVIVTKEDKCVYSSKHGFVRSIKINGKIIGDSVTLKDGSKVSKYTNFDTEVGKDQ